MNVSTHGVVSRRFAEATRRFVRNDRGQGLVEYALVIALVSIVAIAALQYLGSKASNTLNNAAGQLSN